MIVFNKQQLPLLCKRHDLYINKTSLYTYSCVYDNTLITIRIDHLFSVLNYKDIKIELSSGSLKRYYSDWEDALGNHEVCIKCVYNLLQQLEIQLRFTTTKSARCNS